jgi:hypothetical protein
VPIKINKKCYCISFIIQIQCLYSSIEDLEVVVVFERNNTGLKKLSSFLSEQTSDSSAFPNVMCILKRVLSCEQHFLYFDPDYATYGLTVTVLVRVYSAFTRQLCVRSGTKCELPTSF